MTVENLLPRARERLVTVSKEASLTKVATVLGNERAHLVIVCDGSGVAVGVVSKSDIVSRISQCEGHACAAVVRTVMTRDIACCHPEDSLQSIWDLMKARGFLNIPVLDRENRPLGVLYARDVVQALLEEVEYEEVLLREYVMGIGYR